MKLLKYFILLTSVHTLSPVSAINTTNNITETIGQNITSNSSSSLSYSGQTIEQELADLRQKINILQKKIDSPNSCNCNSKVSEADFKNLKNQVINLEWSSTDYAYRTLQMGFNFMTITMFIFIFHKLNNLQYNNHLHAPAATVVPI